MDLDTRWTKYKYSSFNKFLCVLIACIFAAVFALNGLSVIKYIACFGVDSVFLSEDLDIYHTDEFLMNFSDSVKIIIDDVSHNENQKAYDLAKQNTVDRAMQIFEEAKQYKEAESKFHEEYTENDDYSEDYFDVEVTTMIDYDYNWESRISSYSDVGGFNDYGNYFSLFLNCSDQTANISISFEADYSLTSEQAREDFSKQFGNDAYYTFCHNTEDAGESADLELQNIKYYAEYTDGSIATNVENKDEFIAGIKNGDYYILNGGSTETNIIPQGKWLSLASFYGNTFENTRLYVSIDNTFAGDDYFAQINRAVLSIGSINISKCIFSLAFSAVAMIVFLVLSVCLAGHKENEIKTAAIDKLPNDLHLAFTAAAAFFVGFLILSLCSLSYDIAFKQYGEYSRLGNVEYLFAASVWFKYVIMVSGALFYLIILEFVSSITRSIKAGKNIFKNTLIFMIISLVIKAVKLVIINSKKFVNTVLYKHKKLEKRAVLAVIFYTLFNISFLLVIVLLFAFNAFFWGFFASIGILIVLGTDAYLIYKAMNYMKSLDMIISASEKREPLEINTDTLPQSLKILADSLETTNAELQNAVLKAVKDERTKAELITNVSHDLKTPLTSVINYIDLLKKCNIEDETAQKYMTVIDEKSIKLKRLIEDLIEASKVSSGNVTINKTKLNLNELAAQAIVEETADIEKNNLHIIFDESSEKHIVFADGTKLYRVFENLLSNARKYSAAGSRVYARVYSDNNYGYFEIKNISKDPLNISAEELTERFVRGDKSRSEDGNGLGLSIAKELCRLNNGELIITIDGDLFKATVKMPKA